jgi:hypothetical protein
MDDQTATTLPDNPNAAATTATTIGHPAPFRPISSVWRPMGGTAEPLLPLVLLAAANKPRHENDNDRE